ncbi:hypothetical protein ACFVH4_30655 [Nocardia ignorata]|uniref:hypothetical protein n=1 Tax=Nocardia ignorata TaxID=145285 RepID=UPI0036265481
MTRLLPTLRHFAGPGFGDERHLQRARLSVRAACHGAGSGEAAASRALVGAFVRAWHWTNTHSAEWADAYYVRNQEVSPDDARRIVESLGTYTFPYLGRQPVARQQSTIDAIDAAGELPQKITAADGFDLRFDAAITEAVTASGVSYCGV